LFGASALLLNGLAIAQIASPDDDAAIKKTALDYIEGWYTGDAPRMERALHPELAKRMISIDSKTGRSQFNQMGAMALVQRTRDDGGKATPSDRQDRMISVTSPGTAESLISGCRGAAPRSTNRPVPAQTDPCAPRLPRELSQSACNDPRLSAG
jgi:hypothetical protein